MEYIRNASSIIGLIISLTTLATICIKPIRKWVVSIVQQTVNSKKDEAQPAQVDGVFHCTAPERQETLEEVKLISKDVAEIKKTVSDLKDAMRDGLRNDILGLCDKCLTRGYITSIEKMNLMDMYESYHGKLGGDSYCTNRYQTALALEER